MDSCLQWRFEQTVFFSSFFLLGVLEFEVLLAAVPFSSGSCFMIGEFVVRSSSHKYDLPRIVESTSRESLLGCSMKQCSVK